jgi:hypothetical protein
VSALRPAVVLENTRCERCKHVLGYLPDRAVLCALAPLDRSALAGADRARAAPAFLRQRRPWRLQLAGAGARTRSASLPPQPHGPRPRPAGSSFVLAAPGRRQVSPVAWSRRTAMLVLPPCSRSGSKTALQPAHRPSRGTLENPPARQVIRAATWRASPPPRKIGIEGVLEQCC